MSVDVEDYFHVSAFAPGRAARRLGPDGEPRRRATRTRLLDLFDEHGVRATFFVLGWVAERYPDLVKRIAARGHEIASHGYGHRLIYDQTPDAFREDVRRAKQLLEDARGRPVAGYRAPSYSITPQSLWALDVLLEEGYEYDSSIFPIRHDRYGIPGSPRHPHVMSRAARARSSRSPRSTVRSRRDESAGRRRRLLPHPAVLVDAVGHRAGERTGTAARDLLPAPLGDRSGAAAAGARDWLSRFRHYRNLDKTETRLRRLLRDFRFAPVRMILGAVRPEGLALGSLAPRTT